MPSPVQAKAPPRRKPQPHLSGKSRAPVKPRLAKHALKPLAAFLLLIASALPAWAQGSSLGVVYPVFVAGSGVLPLPCQSGDLIAVVRGNTTYKTGCSSISGGQPGQPVNSIQANIAGSFSGIGPSAGALIGWGINGVPTPIALGTNLSLSGSTLNAAGGPSGFPITIGSTVIPGSSSTPSLSGLTLVSPTITGTITGGANATFGAISVTSCSGCGAGTPAGSVGAAQYNLNSVSFGGAGPAANSLFGWDASMVPQPITLGTNLSMTGSTLNATSVNVTWPTTGQLVVSNGTNTPAGLAEVDGLCAVGVSGAWATSSCGPPPGSMTGSGPSTIGDVLQANNTGNPLNSATDTGIPASTVVTLAGTQLLTNKTLTTPTINGGVLSGTFSGSPTFTGQPLFTNTLTGGQTKCLGLDNTGLLIASSGPCSTSPGPLTTTDGTNTVTDTTTQTFGTGFVVGGSAGSATINGTNALNIQAISSYALAASDANKTVWMTNGSAVTNTIPAAGSSGLGPGFAAVLAAQTAGDVFTPVTSTVNGLSSIKLGAYQAAGIQSDGSNYQAFLSVPQPVTQTGSTFLKDDMTWGTISVTPGSIPLANTHILVGNGSGVAADVAMSGDTSIANTGAVTVNKVNAVSYPALPSTNTVPVVTGSNTVTYEVVPNAALANSSTTVNGQTCALGSTCTVTAAATSLTVGSTTVAGGTTAQLLYDNGGVLGEITKANNAVLGTNGTGVASFSTTLPSGLTAPALTVTGSLTATGLVTNSDLANPSTTVNGQTCTLGSSCTVGVSPGSITLTNTHLLVGDASNVAQDVAASGDLTVANTGAFTLATVNSNVGTFQGLTVNGKGLVTAAGAGQLNVGSSDMIQFVPNNGATAPVLHKLAILTGGYTATVALTSSTTQTIGICDANCSTSGTASIAWGGTVQCIFDGATTAADFVVASTTTGGDCHDAGATVPAGVAVMGQVTTTNGGAGTYNVDMNPVGVMGNTGAITYSAGAGLSLTGHTFALDPTQANTWSGIQSFNSGKLVLNGSSSGSSTLNAPATGGGTATLPAGSGTLVYSTGISPGSISLTSAHLLVGNGSNVAADVAASGNISLANTGAMTVTGTLSGVTWGTANLITYDSQSGTSYTLTANDCGGTVRTTSSSAVAITAPNSLSVGCVIVVEQGGSGQITFSAAAGATINSAHSYTKTFGVNAQVSLSVNANSGGSSAVYTLSGDGA